MDPSSDKDFLAAPAHEQHQYLLASDPGYAKAPSIEQARYLAHVRGEVMPQDVQRGVGGMPANGQKVFMGVAPPVDLKHYALDRGAAVASVPTMGMGPFAGAAARTGIQAGVGLADEGWDGALKRGVINAVIEAVPGIGGKVIRSLPGVEGMLKRGLAAKQATGQAAENRTVGMMNEIGQARRDAAQADATTLADTTNRMVQGTFKSQEGAKKVTAQRDADAQTAANLQEWMLKKRGIAEGNDVAGRAYAAKKALAKTDAAAQSAQNAEQTGTNVRRTVEDLTPATGVKANDPRSLQEFAWGEEGWAPIRAQMDAGQANIVRQIRGKELRVPELSKPDEPTIPFELAWMRAGQMRGQAREDAFDALHAALSRESPGAEGMFRDLRKQYSLAKTMQSVGRQGSEPSGGAFDSKGVADWWNKRRDILFRRLGPERYAELEGSLFGRGGAGSVIDPTVTPAVVPKPAFRNAKEAGPKPVDVPSAYVPGTKPETLPTPNVPAYEKATAQTVQPGATVNPPEDVLKWTWRLTPTGVGQMLPNFLSRWRGQVPLSPSTPARTLADIVGQSAREQASRE